MSLTSVCGWATNVVCTNVFYYYYSIVFVFSTYYNWMIDRYAINFENSMFRNDANANLKQYYFL